MSLIPEGRFEARAMPDENGCYVQMDRSKVGKVYVLLNFEITEQCDWQGMLYPWFGSMSDAARKHTIKGLRHCGFVGTDFASITKQALDKIVSVAIEHEKREGRIHPRVKWVDSRTPMLKLQKRLSQAEIADFAASIRNELASAGGSSNPALTSKDELPF